MPQSSQLLKAALSSCPHLVLLPVHSSLLSPQCRTGGGSGSEIDGPIPEQSKFVKLCTQTIFMYMCTCVSLLLEVHVQCTCTFVQVHSEATWLKRHVRKHKCSCPLLQLYYICTCTLYMYICTLSSLLCSMYMCIYM